MRLDGLTYKAIAQKVGISRQRVQQLLSPQRRDDNIIKFKVLHPQASLRAMARIFKLSHTRIADILREKQ